MHYSIDFAKWEAYAMHHDDDPTGCVHGVVASADLDIFHKPEYKTLFQQKEITILLEILLNHPRVVFVQQPVWKETQLIIERIETIQLRGIPVDFGITKEWFEVLTANMTIYPESSSSLLAIHDICLNLSSDGLSMTYFVIMQMPHAVHRLIRKYTIDGLLAEI